MADCSKCKFDDDQHCIGCENGSNFEHMSNADRIRSMTDEELARALTEDTACKMCEYWGKEIDSCNAPFSFVCTKGYAEALILQWLQSEAE